MCIRDRVPFDGADREAQLTGNIGLLDVYKRQGYDYIPVVSVNLSGLEKNPGFSLGIGMLIEMAYSMIYGDLIVHMANQCRPYEIVEGETDPVSYTHLDVYKRQGG